ncbi:MAG: hypothetical protein V2A56_02770 [bacterium]
MIGWIIFGVIVALIAAPLFIPITLTAGVDERRRDWSVRVGTLQVAPDGEVHFKAFRERWAKRLRPLKLALIGLVALLKWIFIALWWVLKAVLWPFKAVIRVFRKRTEPPTTPSTPIGSPWEQEVPDESSVEPQPPSDDTPPSSPDEDEEPDEPSGEIRRGDDPGFISERPENGDQQDEEPGTGASETDMPPSGAAEKDEETGFFGDEDTEAESSSDELGGFAKVLNYARTGLAYLREYGPLGRRVLRAAFLFIGDCISAIQIRRFEGRYGFGGDPAALGALLGWHYALFGSIHPRLPGHLVFVPAFDEEDAPVWGSLDFIVVIWPYRYVLATFRLIAHLPLWGLWRVFRRYRRGELLPSTSSGVSA